MSDKIRACPSDRKNEDLDGYYYRRSHEDSMKNLVMLFFSFVGGTAGFFLGKIFGFETVLSFVGAGLGSLFFCLVSINDSNKTR